MRRVIGIIRGFMNALNGDHVGAYAAQAAYFIMLSFMPFILLLITLLQYTSISVEELYSAAQVILPDSMDSFVLGIIEEVYSRGAVTISLSALVTAWSAGKGFMALIRGMNTIYNIQEQRNYVALRLRSAVYTVVFVFAIVFSLLALVFGDMLHDIAVKYMPLVAVITGALIRLRGMVLLIVLVVFFMIMYRFIPDRKAKILSQAPGAFFSAIGWFIFSFFFSLYMEYSPNLSLMYGSMTTIILIMLWLYFCMYIILIGAEINSYFEEEFRYIMSQRRAVRESVPKK